MLRRTFLKAAGLILAGLGAKASASVLESRQADNPNMVSDVYLNRFHKRGAAVVRYTDGRKVALLFDCAKGDRLARPIAGEVIAPKHLPAAIGMDAMIIPFDHIPARVRQNYWRRQDNAEVALFWT